MSISVNSQVADPGPNNPGISQTSTPVVLLLLDGWGIAPLNEANIFTAAKMPVLSNLLIDYPVVSLKTGNDDWNGRYMTIGAGRTVNSNDERVPFNLTTTLAVAGKQQLKIMDTERLAALTHYFNGQIEGRQIGEEWRVISPKSSGGLQSFHAAKQVMQELCNTLKDHKQYDFIVAAVPYIDLMAMHKDQKSVKKAAEMVDKLVADVLAVLPTNGVLLISSAGGNAEKNLNLVSGEIDRELTDNPVPFLLINPGFVGRTVVSMTSTSEDLSLLATMGSLADIAPTILYLLGLVPPETMSGKNLWS